MAQDPQMGFIQSLFAQPSENSGGLAAVDAYGKNVAAAAGQGAQFAGRAGMDMTRSYVDDYQPYDKQYMNYVDSIGSDAYRAQQRGQAMTSVQQQGDAQQAALRRQAMAAGVNYGDPRYAFMQGQNANQTALNKVMAAMSSDRSSRDEWSKGLGALNAMGLKVGEMGLKNMGLAGDLAKVGMMGADLGSAALDRNTQANASATSASASATGAQAALQNAGTNATNVDQSYKLGLGKLALDRYNIDTGNALKTRALDEAADANSFGNTFLSSVGGAATNWLVNGGIKTLGNGLSKIGSGSTSGGYVPDNLTNDFSNFDFQSGATNALDTWSNFGTGGD